MTSTRLLSLMAASGIVMAACGSSSPTQPSTTPRPTAFEIINGRTGFPDFVLGPGDDVPVLGLTDTGPFGTAAPVADSQVRLESSNPAVLRIAGNHVIGVSPGEAELKATFESLATTAHARVFAASSVSQLVLYSKGLGSNPCWPNDRSSLDFYAVLDDGTRVASPTAVWRSSAPTVASVDANGEVTCHSPGQATIDLMYQGRIESTQYTVRVPQDTLELRGGAFGGLFEPGRTVSISDYGFYVLESAASGRIVQTIIDDRGSIVGTPAVFAIRKGSGEWNLKSTFTVPTTATSLCSRVTLTLDGSARVFDATPHCSPIR